MKNLPLSRTHRPDRRRRYARPLVEGLEVREVPSSFQFPSSFVLFNPQTPTPGSRSITVHVPPNPCHFFPPGPISPGPIAVHFTSLPRLRASRGVDFRRGRFQAISGWISG